MRSHDTIAYLDRDVSWMVFNHRVLPETADPTVPLPDRLGFLAIFSSSLDEFFRVRVAAPRRQGINVAEDPSTSPEQRRDLGRIFRERIATHLEPVVLEAASEQDWIVHFPYKSYNHVSRLAREAASDPRVEEIWRSTWFTRC